MEIEHFSKFLDRLKYKNINILKNIRYEEDIIFTKHAPINKIHPYKIAKLSDKYEQIKLKWGVEVYEDYRMIILLNTVLNNWNEIFSNKYPTCIIEQFNKSFSRFLDLCFSNEGWTVYSDDVYWKDLAIARQAIFPAGAQIVETFSGFSLNTIIRNNLNQFLKLLHLLTTTKGRTGFYQIHTHTPDLTEFHEEGWNMCYLRISKMLEKNSDIKGFFGASWFYDPYLLTISPRLSYLQKRPLENGAKLFYCGKDLTGNAIAKSNTRRTLYNEGKYIPRSYMIVWPRKSLLNWARIYIAGMNPK